MKAIKVEYTVKEEFIEKNKENIKKVMKELGSRKDIMYSSWTKEDKKSFIHIFMSENNAQNPLPKLEAFKQFQAELKQNVEVPPQVTELTKVGASFDLKYNVLSS